MELSCVQFAPVHKNIEANKEIILNYIDKISSRIIAFPELALSGYYFDDREELKMYSQNPETDDFFQLLKRKSKEKDQIFILGFSEISGENIYNSSIAIFPKSEYNFIYRKTHLFYRERFIFDKGNLGFRVINYPDLDLNLGMMICYDWRFPEAARTLGMNGADLIVCPSNLVTELWGKVMPARAIENKVYFAVPNRIGSENAGEEVLKYKGYSAIYSYNGDVLSIASAENAEIITCEIEPMKTRNKSFNEYNNIFSDREPEYYFK